MGCRITKDQGLPDAEGACPGRRCCRKKCAAYFLWQYGTPQKPEPKLIRITTADNPKYKKL